MKFSLKAKVLVVPVLLMFLSTVLLLNVSLWLQNKLWNDYVSDLSQSQAGLAEKSLHSLQTQALTIAAMASEIPGVEKAYELARAGDEAGGRAVLRAGLDTIHDRVTKTMGVKDFKIHYHLPPAKSFLRIWRTAGVKDGGDDISSFRETVLTVNRDKKPLSGIEVGRGGFAIRGLVPVTTGSGRHLGSVETLLDFNKIFETARFVDTDHVAVYMVNEELEIARNLKEKKLPQVGGMVRIFTSDSAATDPYVDADFLQGAAVDRVSSTTQGRLITGIPIRDYSGNVKGSLVFVRDASAQIRLNTIIKWTLVLGGSAFILLLCVVLVLSSSSLVRCLTGVMNDLSGGSGTLSMLSQSISSSSNSLANGATEQAAAIEEVSASMEETSSMVSNNADNARQANSLMGKMGEMTEQASSEMGNLTTAMAEISHASEETSKIIKTIDEIAFQTNLLALNAAVEAARAGEAGAGFAVVADEVRNLAMRAKEAAYNTSVLIEGTIDKVGRGEKIVNETGRTFEGVAQEAREVGRLINEISTASTEQAEGVRQIGKAIGEMESVTQQNSAAAEESAAAATQLEGQADTLAAMVTTMEGILAGTCRFSGGKKISGNPGRDSDVKLLR